MLKKTPSNWFVGMKTKIHQFFGGFVNLKILNPFVNKICQIEWRSALISRQSECKQIFTNFKFLVFFRISISSNWNCLKPSVRPPFQVWGWTPISFVGFRRNKIHDYLETQSSFRTFQKLWKACFHFRKSKYLLALQFSNFYACTFYF